MAIKFPISSGRASWGSNNASSWSVRSVVSASGRRRTMTNQLYPKRVFSVSFPLLSNYEIQTLAGFYNARKGELQSFFFKDAVNNRVENQLLAKGADGKYQLIIPNGDYVEPCEYAEDIEVFVNGVKKTDFTVDGGKLTVTGTGTVTASYTYFYHVAFTGDFSYTEIFTNANSVSLKLQVVRE